MKRIIVLILLLVLISCHNYKKKVKIIKDNDSNNANYVLTVQSWAEPIQKYVIPLDELNEHKIDSINMKADSLLIKIKKYD